MAPARSDVIDVAVVGLGFGAEFLPIYQSHPAVGRIAICDADPDRLDEVGRRFGIAERFTDLDDVLAGDDYDAVHLLTPVAAHDAQTLQVLGSGRHCACAVPMARSLEAIAAIVEAEHRSGKNFMMMETAVYGREFLLVEELVRSGRLGEITYMRGTHFQDLDGFPSYWWGFPPLLYATHALSPLLALAGQPVTRVHGFGSGRLPVGSRGDDDNPFPLETATMAIGDGTVHLDVTVSFLRTARAFHEGFSVYGTTLGFEWPQLEGEDPVLFELGPAPAGRRGGAVTARRRAAPDRPELLPAQIARFTRPQTYDPGTGHAVEVGSHHGGSHPHLVHEFVTSIIEGRPARVDAATAARWCAPGVCAHRSAMDGGLPVDVPTYARPSA